MISGRAVTKIESTAKKNMNGKKGRKSVSVMRLKLRH